MHDPGEGIADTVLSLGPGESFRPLRSPRITTGLALAYRESDVNPLVRRFLEVTRTVVRSRTAVEVPAVAPIDDDYRFTLEF